MSTTNPASPASSAFSPLYRMQAVEHAAVKQYGSVVLARNLSHTVLTVLFAAIAMALIAFFAFFATTRKAQCSGLLIPTAGVLKVVPPQGGVVG